MSESDVDVVEDNRDGQHGWNDGLAEGARSAALELRRVIGSATDTDTTA